MKSFTFVDLQAALILATFLESFWTEWLPKVIFPAIPTDDDCTKLKNKENSYHFRNIIFGRPKTTSSFIENVSAVKVQNII